MGSLDGAATPSQLQVGRVTRYRLQGVEECNKRIAVTSSSIAYGEVPGMKANRMRGNTDKYVNGNVKKVERNIQECQKIIIAQVPV